MDGDQRWLPWLLASTSTTDPFLVSSALPSGCMGASLLERSSRQFSSSAQVQRSNAVI